jgi:hypothetical protein
MEQLIRELKEMRVEHLVNQLTIGDDKFFEVCTSTSKWTYDASGELLSSGSSDSVITDPSIH